MVSTSQRTTWSRRAWLRTAGAMSATAVLAACGQPGPGAPAKPTGPATIDFWLPADRVFEDLFNQELIPRFKQEAPQITVNLQPVPGGWDAHYEKLLTTSAAGTPPDLDRGKEFWAADLATVGALEALDGWLKGQKEVTPDKYHPSVWGISRFRDKGYGVPLHWFVRHLFYNETLLQQAGMVQGGRYVLPQTWQEYAEQAGKLSKRDAGIWGTQLYNYVRSEDNVSHFQYFLTSAGGEYANKERTKLTFNTPQGLETLQFFVDLLFRYGAARPPDVSAPEGQGKIALWFTGAFAMPGYARNSPDLKYGIALMPKHKNRGVVVRGNNLYMFAASKQKEAAFRYATFLARDDNSLIYTRWTSYPPTRKANEEKEPYNADPKWKVVIEQARVKENIWQPFFPGYVEGALRLADELTAAYKGQKSPRDALAAGEKAAQEVLKPPK